MTKKQNDTVAESLDQQIRQRAAAPGSHPAWDQLVRIIWRLRQPDGCPWDKVQTHESIERDLIGEAYEAVDAIERKNLDDLCEELGDVLEQVLLQAQIAADAGEFSIDDVCRGLNEKLIRRHPHVFGDLYDTGVSTKTDSAGKVLDIWDDVKRAERESKARVATGDGVDAASDAPEAPAGLLDSIPIALPALMQAQKISKRAAKAGFEWDSVAEVWDQVAEERREYEAEEKGSAAAQMEFGDLLFALVNVARREGIDAEAGLEASNRKFRQRWARVEELARQQGRAVEDCTTEELNEFWKQAKAEERHEH